jgi:adenylate kinase
VIRIILLGPPGSGKGTQGELLEKKLGLPRIATGDLLRQAVKSGTDLGKRAEGLMNRGDLVPDQLVMELVKLRVAGDDCGKGYILDGFPRTLAQAEMLDQYTGECSEIVLDIKLTDEEIVNRLSSRRVCSGCGKIYNLSLNRPENENSCALCSGTLNQRADDAAEVVLRRLEIYHQAVDPLVSYYQGKGVYHGINGNGSIEEIFADINGLLDDIFVGTEN